MDAPIENIIMSIIQIDKSAIEIRQEFEKDIFNKKCGIQEEIQRLMDEIVEGQRKNLEAIKRQEIESANNNATRLKEEASKKSEGMYQRFLRLKDKLIEETFKDIAINRADNSNYDNL